MDKLMDVWERHKRGEICFRNLFSELGFS